MMTFAQLNLDPIITNAITACGYTKPTPIQAQCIPKILEGKDLVASAQTGSGKTAAFVLPALHRLATNKKTGMKPRVLILTPTRELATQITEAVGKYGKSMRVNIVSILGGMPYRKQLKELSRPVDILVATPGRLMDHMENRRIDLSEIEMLILDEADRMLDMGFIDDVRFISKKTPANRQTLLFSATVDNKLLTVIKELLKNPVRIDLSKETLAPTEIKQEIYMVDSAQHKNRLLTHFLANKNVFKAIIFSGTKINADKLTGSLREQGYEAAALHGDLKQNQRTRTVEDLRRGKIQIIVATDVAARGIDIADISHVFNYDLPKFSEDYIHRIGRTGRAGKTGVAVSFVSPTDARHFEKLKRYTGERYQPMVIEGLEPTKQAFAAPSADKKRRGGGGRKLSGEREFGGRDRKPFKKDGDRNSSSERSFGGRDRKPFKRDDERSPSRERTFGGRDSKPFKRDDERSPSRERTFGGRDSKPFKRDDERSPSRERTFGGRDSKPFKRDDERSPSRERSFGGRDSKPFRRDDERSPSRERTFGGRDSKSFKKDGERSPSRERTFGGRDSKPFKKDDGRSFARSSGDSKKRFKKDDVISFSGDKERPARRSEDRGAPVKRSFAPKGKPKFTNRREDSRSAG